MINFTLLRTKLPIALAFAAATTAAQNHAMPKQEAVAPGRVVISGTVSDEASKAALLARLQELYGPGQVVDQIGVGGVMAPPNWASHVQSLITRKLKSISKGQLAVEGTAVALRGEVANEAVRQSIASDFASTLNSSYIVKNGLRVSAATQSILDQALANRVVEFEAGSALLTDSGKEILDEMADALKKTNPRKLEVVGHTDNIGAPVRNIALSRSRADSVRSYLVAKGIRADIISTSGMGADQPIMPNTTDDGRRRNRRIEFRASQ